MLNSQDLEQLKIDALIQNPSYGLPGAYCADITKAFMNSSSDYIIIRNNSNSNILSFSYVLLAHIFDIRGPVDTSSNSSQSQGVRQNGGSGSKNTDKMQGSSPSSKSKQKDEFLEAKLKLYRVYSFLLDEKINLSDIINIPSKLQRILQQILPKITAISTEPKEMKKKRNLYLKNILIQFLKQIYKKSSSQSSSFIKLNSKQNQSSAAVKQFCIASSIQKYSVSEAILIIFMRSILFYEYEITEALDFNQPISDHTVYTALCDAFQYSTLKLEENHTQISFGSYIRTVRIKQNKQNAGKKANASTINYYMVSLPSCKLECLPQRENQDLDSFRMRRKSSDVGSNNQSVSFRQSSKNTSQRRNYNSNPNSISNNRLQVPQQQAQKKVHQKSEINNIKQLSFDKKNSSKQLQTQSLKVTAQENPESPCLPQHIPKGQNKMKKSQQQLHSAFIRKTLPAQLNGYTNIEILKQLSPKIRESMLKNIEHYKNVVL